MSESDKRKDKSSYKGMTDIMIREDEEDEPDTQDWILTTKHDALAMIRCLCVIKI